MRLYKKELWRVLKSFIFLITVLGIAVFISSQGVLPPDGNITKPETGLESYGMKASNDPALIMPEAASALFYKYSANRYTTYPNGFVKNVRLDASDKEKMSAIILELGTGDIRAEPDNSDNGTPDGHSVTIDGSGLQPNADGSFQIIGPGDITGEELADFSFNTSITWERFCKLMREADELLGGGSDYSETWLSHRFGKIPVTYEEAVADYELTVSEDRYSGAHARLFSDYAGIILGLLPVFPAVFLFMKDRKNIASMLYTRRVSSVNLVVSRYLALLTAIMLPILIMSAVLTVMHGMEYGFSNIDIFAYLKYALAWILPTAMASTAVGVFFTVLTGTPAAIAVQLFWWFLDTLGGSSAYSFFGTKLFQLIPRHNALGKTEVYLDYLPELIQNRLCIAGVSVLLIIVSVNVFSIKRKGALDVRIFKHREIQPEI